MKNSRVDPFIPGERFRPGDEPSLTLVICFTLFIGIGYFFLKNPNAFLEFFSEFDRSLSSFERTAQLSITLFTFNLTWISYVSNRFLKLSAQGAKLNYLKKGGTKSWGQLLVFIQCVFISGITFPALLTSNFLVFPVLRLQILGIWTHLGTLLICFNTSVALSGGYLLVRSIIKRVRLPKLDNKLPKAIEQQDRLLLGTINETVVTTETDSIKSVPEWISIGLKGLTGNLLITGSIGSGKSQVLLQYLKQVLTNLEKRPALLAIDPKRTFVSELKAIISSQGLSDHLAWISLSGTVKFNPIWRKGMLKNAGFITIANTIKVATSNFLGSSGDSRFWEQASFNLLKNCLVYCAAKYNYFTFRELYKTLVNASNGDLGADLVDQLSACPWDPEEQANIVSAIDYFEHEFTQLDEKVRTSILATSTNFINEFLEYRVGQILSPRQEDITLCSLSEAIQDGKLLLLNIENDALARSIGTLLKLMYQEALLERVSDPGHKNARYALLVMDEYQDVASSGGGAGLGDERFLAKARESKAITIAATQSISSLENTIRNENATRELLQNFRTRIFGNSTDPKTIRLFQELRGKELIERKSHSLSESTQGPTRDYLSGGFKSENSSLNESVSTQISQEFVVTAKEFSRLRTFESFAQIFNGVETRFEKLFLKPYFLKNINTPHSVILDGLLDDLKALKSRTKSLSFLLLTSLAFTFSLQSRADLLFPNICTVIRTPKFQDCLNFKVSGCFCGFPTPRPCAEITYYIPQSFIEVWNSSEQSFFSKLPGVQVQLKSHGEHGPLVSGVEDDEGNYFYQARALSIPFAREILSPLPCGGERSSKLCFDLMSEHLGGNWRTGLADSLQPQFQAWSLSPKACLAAGASADLLGKSALPSIGGDGGGCSFPLDYLVKYPPSVREACNGWGIFYPRAGTYTGASSTAAALMVAARLKSLGIEVSHTIPGSPDELWQMIYPQSTSCFQEGHNLGSLELLKDVRETKRLIGRPNGYLFVIWKKVTCCKDLPFVATTQAALLAIKATCSATGGDGV